MKPSVIILFLLSCICPALHASQPQISLKHWTIEDASGNMSIVISADTMDITAPDGATLWYNQRLTGNYEISYRIKMVTDGGKYDRLSDMNCFWAANDPMHPDNLFERGAWRQGIFSQYNSMDLFYVGYGGNYNSTTRFRRYFGGKYAMDSPDVKPLIKEYNDPAHLLVPGHWYQICIRVEGGMTTYMVDGEVLFSYRLQPGEGDGHFGLRLFENHVLFTGFHVKHI